MKTFKSTKAGINSIALTVFLILAGTFSVLYYLDVINLILFLALLLISLLIASSINVADQWEKAVVLRMGNIPDLKVRGSFLLSQS